MSQLIELLAKAERALFDAGYDCGDYGISRALGALGVDISPQGLRHYRTDGARSMRWDVTAALGDIAKLSDKDFRSILRRSYKK